MKLLLCGEMPIPSISSSAQPNQVDGDSTKEMATSTAVAPRAMASGRHSRRTTNQSRPTPELGLVSSTKAQVQGCLKPSTMATAMRMWMLPWNSSSATKGSPNATRIQPGLPAR